MIRSDEITRLFTRCLLGFFVLAQTACGTQSSAVQRDALIAGTQNEYEQAFVTFFPLYEMARLRKVALEDAGNPRRHDLHTFNHVRRLTDHTARNVTAPNNDTLYSSARLDLRFGPVVIETPDMQGRYYSLHLMDFYTKNVAILGSRTAGAGPLKVAVVGPGWTDALPAHTHRVDSETNDMWLLIRTLVDGQADLAKVAVLQDRMHITAPRSASAYPAQRAPTSIDPTPAQFLAVVNEFLERNPPQGVTARVVARDKGLGIEPGRLDAWSQLPETVRNAWTSSWPNARAILMRPENTVARKVQGWDYPPAHLGRWDDDVLLRATIALRGIAPLDLSETLYLSTFQDQQGQTLDGTHRYRVRLPKGGLPVKAFWSITMYDALPDGRFFFVENPIRRYSIGNRTQGLVSNADGTIDIWVQSDRPSAPEIDANWLPSPKGPFRMSVRAYLPSDSLVRGEAELPRVERLTP